MTIKELYTNIGGDYDQAIRVLRMEKLVDKHIRKLTKGGVVDALLEAGKTMDPTALFETAHAVKGVCSNLGLTAIAAVASEISEEYRPGTPRTMTDEEIKGLIAKIAGLYDRTVEGIRQYEEA